MGRIYLSIFNSACERDRALGFMNYRRGRARSFRSVQSALRMHTRRLLTVTFVREAAHCGRNEAGERASEQRVRGDWHN